MDVVRGVTSRTTVQRDTTMLKLVLVIVLSLVAVQAADVCCFRYGHFYDLFGRMRKYCLVRKPCTDSNGNPIYNSGEGQTSFGPVQEDYPDYSSTSFGPAPSQGHTSFGPNPGTFRANPSASFYYRPEGAITFGNNCPPGYQPSGDGQTSFQPLYPSQNSGQGQTSFGPVYPGQNSGDGQTSFQPIGTAYPSQNIGSTWSRPGQSYNTNMQPGYQSPCVAIPPQVGTFARSGLGTPLQSTKEATKGPHVGDVKKMESTTKVEDQEGTTEGLLDSLIQAGENCAGGQIGKDKQCHPVFA